MKATRLILTSALLLHALAASADDGATAPASPADPAPAPAAPQPESSGPLTATEPVEELPPPEEPIPITEFQKPIPIWMAETPSRGFYPESQPDPEQNLGEPNSESCAGNPINMASGNKYQREIDIPALRENALGFERYYNSDRRVHWTHSYSTYLRKGGGYIRLVGADGLARPYLLNSAGNLGTSTVPGAGSLRKVDAGWAYTDLYKNVQTFDNLGRLSQWQARSGYRYTLSYNGAVTTVTDSYGKTLTLQHDAYGRLASASDASITIHYGYDKGGRLISARYGDGSSAVTRQYRYEDPRWPFHLTGLIDERGVRFASWTYDGRGRANSSEHAGGVGKVTLVNDDLGAITLTNPLGKQSIHRFQTIANVRRLVRVEGQASQNCTLSNSSFSYDTYGNLVERIDENGVKTRYAYNALGLETSRTEAYGTPQARTVTTARDSDGVLPVRITEPGRQILMTYDTQGRLVSSTVQGASGQ